MKTISMFQAGEQARDGQDLRADSVGGLEVVDGLESVRQRIIFALRFWLGEWYLNSGDGAPYRPEIFRKPTSAGLAGVIITNRIRGVDGVTGVSNVSVELDPMQRHFTYSASVQTEFGDLTIGDTVG